MELSTHIKISKWDEADRPREKLIQKGISSLSNTEIIATLIRSGTRSMSAVDLAKNILQEVDYDLNALAKLSVKDLQRYKGMGEAKAISIVSALELGRRRKDVAKKEKTQIRSSEDAYQLIKPYLLDLQHEEFWVILLNRANTVIATKKISTGGISGTIADPKIIFKLALEHSASGLILIHNHPSGNLRPSEADTQLTKKIKAAGTYLDIAVLDHVIFSNDGYYSFADKGLL